MNVKKPIVNYLVDLGMAVSFILVFITGIIKFPGLIPRLRLRYASFDMRLMTDLHDWSGLLMGAFVLLHLILHRRWIVCMTKNLLKKKRPDTC